MTQGQLKSLKDASAVASSIWKSKKRKMTDKQFYRLLLAFKTLKKIL